MKTHFDNGCRFSATGRSTSNVFDVTCGVCQNDLTFVGAKARAVQAREEAFNAQEPRTIVPQFGRVNADGVMECYHCHGVLFRERPRSLFSYHYVCASCGTSMHPLTETGMCT